MDRILFCNFLPSTYSRREKASPTRRRTTPLMRSRPFPQQILTQAKPAMRTNSNKQPGGAQSIKNDKRNRKIETTSEILETPVLLINIVVKSSTNEFPQVD